MINIKSKRGQRQQQRELVLMMMQIERAWVKTLNRIFKQFYIDAADEVNKGFTGRIEWVVDKRAPELRQLFKKYYKIIGVTFFKKLFSDVKKSGLGPKRKAFDEDDMLDTIEAGDVGPIEERFWKVYGDWSNVKVGKNVKKVTGTVKRRITKIVSDMMEEGMAHREIAEAISEKSSLSMWEALRIARTETHQAAVFSTQGAIESTGKEVGLEFNKYWVSANDDRSRLTHIAAGERYNEANAIPMDDKYEVGDAELLYPGDDSAGVPEETIICRCVELYVPAQAGANPS